MKGSQIMEKQAKPVVITVASDEGEVSYTSNSERAGSHKNSFAGGVFEGEQSMIDEVLFLLNKDFGPEVAHVSYYQAYRFSEDRDTLEDIAGAMAGAFQRHVLNAKARKILSEALARQADSGDGDDAPPPADGDIAEIIY